MNVARQAPAPAASVPGRRVGPVRFPGRGRVPRTIAPGDPPLRRARTSRARRNAAHVRHRHASAESRATRACARVGARAPGWPAPCPWGARPAPSARGTGAPPARAGASTRPPRSPRGRGRRIREERGHGLCGRQTRHDRTIEAGVRAHRARGGASRRARGARPRARRIRVRRAPPRPGAATVAKGAAQGLTPAGREAAPSIARRSRR